SSDLEAPQAIREIIRRAGHEIRNALNGVAVNVEVVRSRSGVATETSRRELTPFAERAMIQVGEASALTDGLVALVNSVLAAQAAATLESPVRHGGGSRSELM